MNGVKPGYILTLNKLVFLRFCILALLIMNCEPESESRQIEKLRSDMSQDNKIHILLPLYQSSSLWPRNMYWVTAATCRAVDPRMNKTERCLFMGTLYQRLKFSCTSLPLSCLLLGEGTVICYLLLPFSVRFPGFIQWEKAAPSSVSPGCLLRICTVACGVECIFPSDPQWNWVLEKTEF